MRRTRAAAGDDFVLMFRLSMLDLVEGGSSWEEVVELAKVRPPRENPAFHLYEYLTRLLGLLPPPTPFHACAGP